MNLDHFADSAFKEVKPQFKYAVLVIQFIIHGACFLMFEILYPRECPRTTKVLMLMGTTQILLIPTILFFLSMTWRYDVTGTFFGFLLALTAIIFLLVSSIVNLASNDSCELKEALKCIKIAGSLQILNSLFYVYQLWYGVQELQESSIVINVPIFRPMRKPNEL